jgi:hypothetical protein
MKQMAACVVLAVMTLAVGCSDGDTVTAEDSEELEAALERIEKLEADLERAEAEFAATTEALSDPASGESAPSTTSTTTEAPVTTTAEAPATGETLLFLGSGASTLDLGGPLDAEYLTLRYYSEGDIRVLLLDDSGSQVGYYGHFYAPGGAQGVRILTTDTADATFMEVSAAGEWSVEFLPQGTMGAEALEAGRQPDLDNPAIYGSDGVWTPASGETATGTGDFIISHRGAPAIWTIDVAGCDDTVETAVYDGDGNPAYSAGQYLLEEEHQGVVEQFIPTDGHVEIQSTCYWVVTVP